MVSISSLTGSVSAKDLLVGPTRPLKAPSQAAAAAKPGDVVKIDPGEYDDCAVWRTPNITIQAAGPPVVMTGRTCAKQGIFVIQSNDVTVDGLVFRNAAVEEHNGAGIKMNGDNLTVRNSRFERNENGILAGGSDSSIVRISDSAFIGNGSCVGACAHGLYIGQHIQAVEIDNCRFLGAQSGHHIKSRAHRTTVRNSRVEDGLGGTASYLIDVPNGGDILIENTILQKGPKAGNHTAAIMIAAEGATNPATSMVIRNNHFRNEMGASTAFVRNESATPVQLIDNRLVGPVVPLQGPGSISP